MRRFKRSLSRELPASGGSEHQPAPAAPSGVASGSRVSSDGILADLQSWAAEISDEDFAPDDLDPDASIFDEGYVDSMSYVELLARIEVKYGVAIPDEQVVGSSLGDLARYVEEEAAA